jgi:hypothetical protein
MMLIEWIPFLAFPDKALKLTAALPLPIFAIVRPAIPAGVPFG